MIKLFEFNEFDTDNDGKELEADELQHLCTKLITMYPYGFAKFGFFGAWDGPIFGGALIKSAEELYGHITQYFAVNMSIELYYANVEEGVREVQRYCDSTILDVPRWSLVLIQHHHDGTNQYIIRPLKKNKDYNGDGSGFIDWCRKNTKKLLKKDVIEM